MLARSRAILRLPHTLTDSRLGRPPDATPPQPCPRLLAGPQPCTPSPCSAPPPRKPRRLAVAPRSGLPVRPELLARCSPSPGPDPARSCPDVVVAPPPVSFLAGVASALFPRP
ncbi:hypothetical protein ZWY2020_052663 [Hordeum vulgare]|nr:hypothetical protein ZWY2020_052663 [Hordeum vulgare]